MYEISVNGHFDAAHFLRDYPGKCSREHGHRFSYQVTITGAELDKLGMLVDFADIKMEMRDKVEEYLDHQLLNDLVPFNKFNPTAENLAEWIYHTLKSVFSNITKVTVWESPDAKCTYYEEY